MVDNTNQKGIIVWRLGYNKSRQKARDIYNKIGSIHCPALKDELVAFNRIGLNHLIRKGDNLRPKNEQKRRFILLQYVENIITDQNADIEFRKYSIKEKKSKFGNKIMIQSDAYFWTFSACIRDCKIKVVVRQVGNGQKHFFSIMGDRVLLRKATKNTNDS